METPSVQRRICHRVNGLVTMQGAGRRGAEAAALSAGPGGITADYARYTELPANVRCIDSSTGVLVTLHHRPGKERQLCLLAAKDLRRPHMLTRCHERCSSRTSSTFPDKRTHVHHTYLLGVMNGAVHAPVPRPHTTRRKYTTHLYLLGVMNGARTSSTFSDKRRHVRYTYLLGVIKCAAYSWRRRAPLSETHALGATPDSFLE